MLHDSGYSPLELRRRIGNMDQAAAIRLVQFDDANERPARAALFHTGSGLEFTVFTDRGMDIASATFNGKALGWRSPSGNVAPQYFEPEGGRWLRSFFGGLLTTCGLMNVGSPDPDSAVNGRGVHGRIGNIPARNLKVTQEWQGDDYVLSVTGTMREATLFGENLSLTRTVSTKLGEQRFWLNDVLTNEGFNDTQYQILYHWNIGWPIVDEGSEVITPSQFVAPRDAESIAGKEEWASIHGPVAGYKEKVYYHDMLPAEDGAVTCALLNAGFETGKGFGVYMRYKKDELPRFTHWKNLDEQAYVIGMEPCTCGVEGRHTDQAAGLLHTVRAGESKTFHLEFGVVNTQEEAAALRAARDKVKTKIMPSYRDFVKKPL